MGDGTQRRAWEGRAKVLGIDRCVTFHGFISEDKLRAAYARCDVFCMPGVAELQSLATLEAMATGGPIVAAKARALPHLVRHRHNGYLYTPGDVRELSTHLQKLLCDIGLRHRMGEASRRIAETHLLEHTLTRFEKLYETAINQARHEDGGGI